MIGTTQNTPDTAQIAAKTDPWIQVSQTCLVILPAVQAIIVDCPITWIIFKLFRKQEMKLDVRRVIRLFALIVFSFFYIGIFANDIWGISYSL